MNYDECPVCYAPLKVQTSTVDWGGPIAEQYETCPNKCYIYEFAYGSTLIYVNIRGHAMQFSYHYSDEAETIRLETVAVNLACEAARRTQLEDYWKATTEKVNQAVLAEHDAMCDVCVMEEDTVTPEHRCVRGKSLYKAAHEDKTGRS
jgi:hypothetical protein